jgi:hypothetical protein
MICLIVAALKQENSEYRSASSSSSTSSQMQWLDTVVTSAAKVVFPGIDALLLVLTPATVLLL